MLKGMFVRPTAVGSMLLLGFLLWIGRSANAGAESFTLTDPDSFAPLLTLEQDANVIAGQYIVVLNENPVTSRRSPQALSEMVQSVAATHVAAGPTATFSRALTGFAATLTEAEIAALQADSRVAYIEPDQIMSIAVDQPNPTWGLDRIDQRSLPLDDNYRYDFDGTGVDLYVIDTGILSSHVDFDGRVVGGFNSTGGSSQNYEDCNGHGTHVAGTAGGTTYGVAKNVNLYAVRVLGCNGSGTSAGVIAGIDWVTANADGPSVANMSLGGPASNATDDAVRNSIAAGITYAVASGNDNRNACSFSPARVEEALTVNASTSADRRASFSNFGTCTDIFAPGQSITSAWYTSRTALNTISGTSMAAPHVAGVAALYLSGNGNASPAEVKSGLEGLATTGEISNPGSGSPNLLLYSLVDGGNPLPTATPTATNTPLPSPTPLPGNLIFFDDFESDNGWTTDPDGTDTASTGAWEVANPEETEVEGVKQLGRSFSGNQNLVTGAPAGTGAGSFDIDSGVTTVESTPIALPASGSLTLFFTYYLAHLDNGTAADYFRIAIRENGGTTTTTIFEELAQAENDDAAWESRSVDISDFAGQTVTVLIAAADNGDGSLIEAGVDDLFITQEDDGGPPPTQIPTATPLPPTATPLPPTVTPSPTATLVNSPTPAPTATPPPVDSEIYFDDFETDRGWTVDPNGTDTATTGIWEIGSPQATSNFGIKQLGTSLSGSQNLVTGLLAGANAGSFDIDNGVVSILSPEITLPQSNNIVLSFGYYLAHGSNATGDDYLRVAVVGSTTTVVFEELGVAENDNAAWETTEVSLSQFAGQTINILISAADNGQPSLVEAAIDDLLISSDGSGSGSAPSPTPTPQPGPANLAPIIVDPGATLLQTGQLAVLPLTVTDPEGDEIRVDVLGLSQEFSFDPVTNEIVGLPFASGHYDIQVVATDSAGNRSELIFSLTVVSEQPDGRALAPLYDDTLSDAWSLSVWGVGEITTDNPAPVAEGEASLQVDLSGTLSSIAFEPVGPFDLTEFDYIQFDIHGIDAEQAVRFAILDSQFQEIVGFSLSASNGEWRNVLVPLSARAGALSDGVVNLEDAAYVVFRDQALAGTLYLDNVVLFQADPESQPPVQAENPLYLPIIAVPFDS